MSDPLMATALKHHYRRGKQRTQIEPSHMTMSQRHPSSLFLNHVLGVHENPGAETGSLSLAQRLVAVQLCIRVMPTSQRDSRGKVCFAGETRTSPNCI